MTEMHGREWDELQQQLGAQQQQIVELQQKLSDHRQRFEPDAREWQRLLRHRSELAEWLIENATNEHGRLVEPRIDAALGGEAFVPCSFTGFGRDKRYRLELVSTVYEIKNDD